MIADESRAKGAAIGAGLGALACYLINAQSKQTRPPAEVEGQYRAEHQGALPEQSLVTAYDTAFHAGGGVKAGQEARVVSSSPWFPVRGSRCARWWRCWRCSRPPTRAR